ncbi:MAG: xanthine dehydrogenase family protein molybdopterin-binding subunit [Kordiimonadaceae bacterium]|nr:xanthine dehydrogenase family protein molybdopterin-binding subunit [Kordiimonadaceae bacterium]MBO6567227.1 xanthine dehydrogenase family protein molybdopterin-binding subunit [Kordiimonadaceae bacterium]MBO6963558.1 xanthine dehydrogenase family protein molybdopterin-binding subunit [Kordiimonadaceae bacterium]
MASLNRRVFLKSATATATMVVMVSQTPHILAQDAPSSGSVSPCLKLDSNGQIALCVPIPDMGQGMETTAAQMIADELNVNLDDVKVELMPFLGRTNAEGRAVFGRFYQGGGGSGSTMRIYHEVRRTAAYARTVLLEAAARNWRIPRRGLVAENGHVRDPNSERSISYTDLLQSAQSVGDEVKPNSIDPKPANAHTAIGKDTKNVHGKAIVTGEPIFGIDADISDMAHAVVRRCPYLNGDVVGFDDTRARQVPGVIDITTLDRIPEDKSIYRSVAAGVAVIAETYWAARKAADLIEIEWDGSASLEDDTEILKSRCLAALDGDDFTTSIEGGDLQAALSSASHVVEATYIHPHWAHTCIEPHSCIANVQGDEAEIWVGHQFMDAAINGVTNAVGISPDKVKANFYRMGTGFGRKFEEDFVMEAALLSKAVGRAVKVTWSREDEMEQDYVNSLGAYRLRAAIDGNGNINGWHIRAASDTVPAIITREYPARLVGNYKGEFHQVPNGVSRGAWRGPHHNVAGWVIQSFLDEIAAASGKDRLQNLLDVYSKKDVLKSLNWPYRDTFFERYRAVLQKAADESGFGKKMPAGWGQGIAVHHTFVSVCAHVVEVEMLGDNDYRVHRVTSAIDCGLAVNPLGVRAQVESGIMDGLCAAKYGKWTLDKGLVTTNNFDSYQKMRINEAPAYVDIHILDFGETEPRGTGEVSLPPVIPALTNAIFAASGKRLRSLPISENL